MTRTAAAAAEIEISNWKILVQHIILYILLAKVFTALYSCFSLSRFTQADLFFKRNDDDDGDTNDDDVEDNTSETLLARGKINSLIDHPYNSCHTINKTSLIV